MGKVSNRNFIHHSTRLIYSRMKMSGEQIDDRIVEVHWDAHSSHWRMMRFRDDKPQGNHRTVVENIIQTIIDGVEKESVRDGLNASFGSDLSIFPSCWQGQMPSEVRGRLDLASHHSPNRRPISLLLLDPQTSKTSDLLLILSFAMVLCRRRDIAKSVDLRPLRVCNGDLGLALPCSVCNSRLQS